MKEPFLRSQAIATLLFFFSGATGLIYEVLWTRQFELILGATTYSAGAVLAAFMGGLFLGSRIGGRWAGSFKNPLWVYGGLELGIGLYAFTLASSFHQVDLSFQFLENHWPYSHSLFIVPRFFGCLALLVVPTTFMGATLPCLSSLAKNLAAGGSSYAGRLYAINTTGAVAGAVLAGYWLLPAFGQWKTTWLAALANGLLGLAALGIGIGFNQKKSPGLVKSGKKPLEASLRAALVVAGLSGIAAMMDEVGYNRILCMVLGGSAYAFSAMLASFLTGLSVGSFVFSKSKVSGPSAVRGLVIAQLALGVVVLLSLYSFDHLWMLFMSLVNTTDQFHLDLDQWQKGIQFLVAFVILFPTAFLSGAVFPLVLKADPRFSDNPAGKVGRVYGANTLGAILGALLASLVLIPWVGVQKTLEAGICLNFLAAGLLLVSQRQPSIKKVFWPAVGILLVLPPTLWAILPTWNRHNLAVGPFFQAISASDYISDFSERLAESDLLYYKEGLVNTVTVEKAPQFNTIVLSNNGKVEASSVGDLPTEQLVSHIPLLWRECTLQKPARKVAVIGLASGITAGSVLAHNPLSLDVVDLEPFMPLAAAFFKDFNFQILTDLRFHFFADDARHYFRLASQKYDVIISEPSNPWLAGVSNLFSREFFEIGKKGLAEGGVYAQWVQIYGMKTDDVRAICRTFSSVFPYVYVFMIPPAPGEVKPVPDLVLLGSLSQLKPHIPYMETAIRSPDLQKALDRIDVKEAGDLVSMLRMGPEEVKAFCEGAGIDTDDNGLIEFSAPLHLYDGECYASNMMEIRKFQPDPSLYVEPENPSVLKRTLLRVSNDLKGYWGSDFAAGLKRKAVKL